MPVLFKLTHGCSNNNKTTQHYNDIIMSVVVSQITAVSIVYAIFYSRADQKKKSKLHMICLCVGNLPVTDEFPTQRASNMENVSI